MATRTDRLDHAVCGDLPRQRETLRIGLEHFPIPPQTHSDRRWNAYDLDAVLGGSGRAATMSGAKLQAVLDEASSDWVTARGVGSDQMETYADYQFRCSAALESARALAGSGKTALVVSSAGTITQILAQLWGLDGEHWIRMAGTMINAAVTKLYERLGICAEGEGDKLVAENATSLGGRIPFSTDGALIGRGHPGGPTGLAQIWETTLQLRGEAGERQVPNARVGLCHMVGGGSVCVVHILQRGS